MGSVPTGFLIVLQAFDRDGDNKLDVSDLGPLLEVVRKGSGRRLGSSSIEEALQSLSGDSDDQVRTSAFGAERASLGPRHLRDQRRHSAVGGEG